MCVKATYNIFSTIILGLSFCVLRELISMGHICAWWRFSQVGREGSNENFNHPQPKLCIL